MEVMEEKHLHIICFDVPYPADYGGVLDPFYKIKTLHELGIKIHLHCFEYGRGEQPALNRYCEKVNYYSRQEGHKGFSHKLPYIVCSRSDKGLLDNLLKDQYPILVEGIHCSFLLNDQRFAHRRIFLRLHNVEYKYYRQLYRSEHAFAKKMYYLHESYLLKRYERDIANKAFIVSMSGQDADFYRKELGAERIEQLPVFVPYQHVQSREEHGGYCLYHGNLSVAENEAAVIWLLQHVFDDLEFPFVIAGKNPSARLERLAHEHKDTCLVSNPTDEEMHDIISKAQVNILPSFNSTGIKFKLLNALFNGRHCIVNQQAVERTGLESLCHIASEANACKDLIRKIYHQPFGHAEIKEREQLLSVQFNNEKNGRKLIEWIW